MCFSSKDTEDDIEPPRPAGSTDDPQAHAANIPAEADDSDLTNIIGHYIRHPLATVPDRPDLKKLRLFILRSLTMAIIMRRKLGHNDIVIALGEILQMLYRKSEIAAAARQLEGDFEYELGKGEYNEERMMRESLLLYGAEAAGCLYQYKPDMAIRVREVADLMWNLDLEGTEGKKRLSSVPE